MLSDHDLQVAPDVVTTLSLNYEWRRLLSDALQSHADSIIRNLDDSLVDDYRNKFQATLNDLYTSQSLAEQYRIRVLATSPLRFNRLNEGAGSVMFDSSGAGYAGTYTGVTWDVTLTPFGDAVPFWDGVNDYGNLYSAAFATAFNMNEFTIMLWFKLASLSVWTDGLEHYFYRIQRDSSNQFLVRKSNAHNTIAINRIGAGVSKSIVVNAQSDTGFVCLALSGSVIGGGLLAAGEMKAYKNGIQIGSTATGILAAPGSGLNSATTVLGAASTAPSTVNHGYLSNFIVWTRPIDNDILALMTVH